MQVAKRGINRMPLIGRAWKANVNVRKRQLILQLVFNRGECMMHVDKNADDHIVDVDRISREIAYVPLNGRIRSKRSSCMQDFFFFFFFLNEYNTCLPVVWWIWSFGCFPKVRWIWNLDMLPRGPMDLKFGRAFQRSDDLILDVLPRGPLILNSNVLLRGPLKLNFERASQRSDGLKFRRASQRSDGFEIWACFPEVRWIEV